jgi:hypothetical protein
VVRCADAGLGNAFLIEVLSAAKRIAQKQSFIVCCSAALGLSAAASTRELQIRKPASRISGMTCSPKNSRSLAKSKNVNCTPSHPAALSC